MSLPSIHRRTFLGALAAPLVGAATPARRRVETVRGPVDPARLGTTLIHEHILVDFIGAEQASPSRYNADDVIRAALPKLRDLRERGCRTFVDCTPEYLGRDPEVLRRLSESIGLQIVTNTGLYGANKGRHLPAYAWKEPADGLAERWTSEYRNGIGKTGIKPGFLKIGVNAGALSEIDAKLITAAARCHKWTGLRMHVHTGDGRAAMGVLDVLAREGVPPSAYVWVHAQSEKDQTLHVQAAKAGAWLEFDGIGPTRLEAHTTAVRGLIEGGFLRRLLISHDSGWYRVGEPGGGEFNGFTYLFDAFARLFTPNQMRAMLMDNPARVLTWPDP